MKDTIYNHYIAIDWSIENKKGSNLRLTLIYGDFDFFDTFSQPSML